MEKIKFLLEKKELTYREVVVYILIEEYTLRTASELAIIMSSEHSILRKTLKKLIDLGLIDHTYDRPARYYIEHGKK